MMHNRPPIVVILGHVDHGKTTLLDALRKTSIAAREIGGITQSTRSFQLLSPTPITFIDTPGHAIFSHMRSRGGKIADIALLVVAANDGVMPQTKESIATIQAAKIPYIVVANKIDLPEANLDRVKAQLAENSVLVEGYGGDVPMVTVSAKNGQGLKELLEMIQLVSELTPPQADPDGSLEAVVLESSLDPKKGVLATVIVKNGTLREGASLPLGKVKALTATSGERIKEALPSQPVEILGLTKVPEVGSVISDSESKATSVTAPKIAKPGTLNIILKTDVVGSLEAIVASVSPELDIIQAGTGDISESDVMLSLSTGAQIIGFNVKVPGGVAKLAETEKIKIRTYSIIYELLDAVELLLHPLSLEHVVGKAEIKAEFKFDGQRVAGCKVTEGELKKSDLVRVMRGEEVVGETRFKSLRTGKTELTLVKGTQEFGALMQPYLDFKTGDVIIAYQIHGSI